MADLNDLKRDFFFRLLEMAGRVFVMIRYSDDVVVGRRGFLEEEKEDGLVLVFNDKMKFTWDEAGISATLVFGTAPEKCFIPADNIVSVYSPELKVHLAVTPEEDDDKESGPGGARGKASKKPVEPGSEGNVIRVDFKRKE
jgi:hypothetical protein